MSDLEGSPETWGPHASHRRPRARTMMEGMDDDQASSSLCSLTSPILQLTIHSLQLPANSIPDDRKHFLLPHKSRRNREVSTPAERRADHSRALTIVNRSTIEKVQRNHRYHSPDFCSVLGEDCKVLSWMVVTNRCWVDRAIDNRMETLGTLPSKVKKGRSTFRHYNLQLVSPGTRLFHL